MNDFNCLKAQNPKLGRGRFSGLYTEVSLQDCHKREGVKGSDFAHDEIL